MGISVDYYFFMAKTKYRRYVERMLEVEKDLFDKFRKLHDKYILNEDELQDEFNKMGEKILGVVREWENKLCSNTERGMYNKFSSNLAEKFQAEVKKIFPKIDNIGLIIEKPQEFVFKKINLN